MRRPETKVFSRRANVKSLTSLISSDASPYALLLSLDNHVTLQVRSLYTSFCYLAEIPIAGQETGSYVRLEGPHSVSRLPTAAEGCAAARVLSV